jgi:hypothetical protein
MGNHHKLFAKKPYDCSASVLLKDPKSNFLLKTLLEIRPLRLKKSPAKKRPSDFLAVC